ncbi:hypothetical protein GOODEAATRI_031085 [Goodea atripinnis]|uniref:Uncharacterized protein n=1 Tax=Goodea atripinnis TaxID=208336 RepID=A0ABV0NF48_9TELE
MSKQVMETEKSVTEAGNCADSDGNADVIDGELTVYLAEVERRYTATGHFLAGELPAWNPERSAGFPPAAVEKAWSTHLLHIRPRICPSSDGSTGTDLRLECSLGPPLDWIDLCVI